MALKPQQKHVVMNLEYLHFFCFDVYLVMINEEQTRKYCCEDPSLIENYDKAVSDPKRTWACHHRLEIQGQFTNSRELLKKCGMYWKVPASQLIFLTLSDHMSLHSKHISETTRNKMSNTRRGVKRPIEVVRKYSEAQRGKVVSEETRKKLSESHKGKKLSEETRLKLSKANSGKHLSDETKQKLSEAAKGKPKPWLRGRARSEETRRKLAEATKAYWAKKKAELTNP